MAEQCPICHNGKGEYWGGHSSTTLGTTYPQVVVVNWLPSQDAVSTRGVNSMISCPSLPPAHFPSPPEEEFTVHESEAPCSMQAKPLLQTDLICITCSAMSGLWCVRYVVSPRTKSAHKISWRGSSLTTWRITYSAPPSQMAWPFQT